MSTIKDVAKYAGVSIATVSRVINHVPNVKPETAEKVNQAIQACNFVPNLVARSLKNEHTKTIGLIISDIANSYFSVMAKDLEMQLQKAGYDLFICSTDDDADMERNYLTQLLSNQVVGVILNTTGKNESMIEEISRQIPMVLIERSISASNYTGDFVGANNRDAIYEITSHLLEIGHRKIAIINGNREVSTGQERYQGFQDAMSEYGIPVTSEYLFQYDANSFLESRGYEAAQHLFSLREKPTALIVANNTLSIGALKYIKKNNIQVPSECSVVCYGNIENSELFFVNPAYTTLNPHTIARKAYQYIISRIETQDLPNRETIFTSQLYLGESIAPPA